MLLLANFAFSDVPLWAWMVWLFVVGACIGSFLNVVIYRVPAGKSLIRPGSHCPKCNKPIRARHNIPIFGWLMLRGKCHDCAAPISVRYPLVELAVGTIFVVLAGLILGTNAMHLPQSLRSTVKNYAAEDVWQWQTVLFAYHTVLACFLISAGLIAFDEMRQKAKLAGFAAFIGLAMPLFWPWLRPTHFLAQHEEFGRVFVAIWDGIFGFAAGIVIGYLVAFARKSRRSFRADIMSVLAVIGAFLGWQAVMTISVAAAVAELGRRWSTTHATSKNPAPWISVAAFFAGVHLFAWRWVAVYSYDQTETTQGIITVVMLAIILICSWGHQKVLPADGDSSDDSDSAADRRKAAMRDKPTKNRKA